MFSEGCWFSTVFDYPSMWHLFHFIKLKMNFSPPPPNTFQVADGALRCFASLADRFTRRGVDPAPLARHGLTNELLERLANCGQPASFTTTTTPSSTPRPAAGATPDSKSNPNISTVISLLSTLCRGSPTVTHVNIGFLEFIYTYM